MLEQSTNPPAWAEHADRKCALARSMRVGMRAARSISGLPLGAWPSVQGVKSQRLLRRAAWELAALAKAVWQCFLAFEGLVFRCARNPLLRRARLYGKKHGKESLRRQERKKYVGESFGLRAAGAPDKALPDLAPRRPGTKSLPQESPLSAPRRVGRAPQPRPEAVVPRLQGAQRGSASHREGVAVHQFPRTAG